MQKLNPNKVNSKFKSDFENLYNSYKSVVFSICYNILKNREDTEDAMNEVFFTLANKLNEEQIANYNGLRNLIITISRNIAINIYRKRKIRYDNIVAMPEDWEDYISDTLDTEDECIELIVIADFQKELYELAPKDYDIIYLEVVKQLTPKQISEVMGLSIDNVYKRLQRAKRKLKGLMQREAFINAH